MPDLNCEISYPGAISIASADYTLLHGIAPGVVRMSCNAVDDVALGGTVTLGDGRQRLVLTGCRVDRCEIDASSSGYTATLYLFDKRWRWKLGQINGHYNEPSPRIYDVPRVVAPGQQAGNQPATEPPEKLPDIQEPTRKNARDLAKLLLETMGERTYDIAAIPSNDYPEVKWEAAVPAVELQNLAERYGCRVVYRPDVDGVLIAKLGVGAQLPDGLLDSDNLGIDPPEPPGRIVVYGAPVRYQVRFELEAVGLDFDGVVRPIDDLSYTPAQGWESAGPPFPFSPGTQFLDPLPGERTWYEAKQLADQTVFRWYRISQTLPGKETGEFDFWIPPNSTDKYDNLPRNLIELLPHGVETSEDDLGDRVILPARVYGETNDGSLVMRNTDPGEQIFTPFTIDAERQLIQFAQFMTLIGRGDNAGKSLPAVLTLETACTVRDIITNVPRRYKFELPLTQKSKAGRPPRDELAIIREDIRQWVRVVYTDTDSNDVNKVESNGSACKEKAEYYARGEAAKFQTRAPQQRSYIGINPIMPDGAIQSVSWSVGPGGVLTRASRDSELRVVVQSYAVRRAQEETSLARMAALDRDISASNIKLSIANDFGAS